MRAQLVLGRGSATDSLPLFGFDLGDYNELFEEKLDLMMRPLRHQPVTWSGRSRSTLKDRYLYQAIPEGNIPVWTGVGGSPASLTRAARYGLPLHARHHRRRPRPVRATDRTAPSDPGGAGPGP